MPNGLKMILVVCCLALAVSPFQAAQAAPKQIPQTPSAPPLLTQSAPEDPFHCKRVFVYQGKTLECDSAVQQDGERLRPVLEKSPAAIKELNTYQQNRRDLRKAAYVSTAGFAIALACNLLNSTKEESSRPLQLAMYGGFALSAGSLAYAIAIKTTNDRHLGKAVDLFNRENPDNPIELQFSTGFTL